MDHKNKMNIAVTALVAMTSGMMTTSTALAQGVMDEIIVSARMKDETLQDVPVSINVTSGQTIQDQGFRDLQSVIADVPAVNVSRGGGNANMYIRGIGSGINSGFEQAVGFVVDGVAMGRSRATRAALTDVARVEVLKGPQSTYFGANTSAGAINIITNSADIEVGLGGYVRSTYEFETDESVLEGAVNVPVSDTFAMRIVGKFSDSKGHIDNVFSGERFPANEDTLFRVSTLWQPNDNFDAKLKLTYGTLDSNSGLDTELANCIPGSIILLGCSTASGQPIEAQLNYVTNKDLEEFRTFDYLTSSLELSYQLGENTLTSITGYYDQDAAHRLDFDHSDVPSAIAVSRFSAIQNDDADQVSQELRLSSPGGETLDWVVGLYYQKESIDFATYAQPAFSPPAPGGVMSGTVGEQEATTISIFGALTYNITDRLIASLGLRYLEVDKDMTRSRTGAGPIPAGGIPVRELFTPFAPTVFESKSQTADDILPSLDIQYEFSDDLNLYAKFAQGFKAGAFSLQNSPPGVLVNFIESVTPETVDAFEIGIKGSLLEQRLKFGVALFRSDYKDLQVSTRIEPPAGSTAGIFVGIANAAESETQGLELDFRAQLNDRLSLSGDLAFLDATYSSFPDAPCYETQTAAQGCVAGLQDVSGKPREFAPDFAGNLTVTFEQPIGDYVLTIASNVTHSDGYFLQADLDPLHVQSSYTKLNLRAALTPDSGKWELAFVGRNLTDKLTVNFCSDLPAGPGMFVCAPDLPATYAIQGRFNF
jgi:iron complex outermembrane receptor protein